MSAKRWLWAVASLTVVSGSSWAQTAELRTFVIESQAVGRRLNVRVALPPGYEGDEGSSYPVLYLLHGYGGNYIDWSRALGAASYAAAFDLIVVMPDAGNSYYVNWSESDDGERNDWEDYILREVIPYVDANFRTIAKREGRAIGGLSMGGYGAITMGLRHPELFISIASTSGALATARRAAERLSANEPLPERPPPSDVPDPVIDNEAFDSQAERTPNGRAFTTAARARGYDPFRLVSRVPRDELPHIYLDCGLDDRLYEDTRAFAEILMRNSIPFSYLQLDGGHEAPYWIRALGHSMATQYEVMMRALDRRPFVRRRP